MQPIFFHFAFWSRRCIRNRIHTRISFLGSSCAFVLRTVISNAMVFKETGHRLRNRRSRPCFPKSPYQQLKKKNISVLLPDTKYLLQHSQVSGPGSGVTREVLLHKVWRRQGCGALNGANSDKTGMKHPTSWWMFICRISVVLKGLRQCAAAGVGGRNETQQSILSLHAASICRNILFKIVFCKTCLKSMHTTPWIVQGSHFPMRRSKRDNHGLKFARTASSALATRQRVTRCRIHWTHLIELQPPWGCTLQT